MGDPRRGARGAVATLAVVAAVLGACAQRDSTADTFPGGSARAMLLRLDDLPARFREGSPPEAVQPTAESARQVQACARGVGRHWGVASPTFVDDAERTVQAVVWVEPSAAGAHRMMAGNIDGATVRCIARDVYGPRSVIPPVVRPMRFPGVGDESAGWRVILDLGDARLYLDQAYVRVGRFVAQVGFVTRDDRFTPDEEEQLVRTIIDRAPD
ncbi:MAG TPA: hypothetical protein VKB57_06485 [Acidimicrobiales bacterium]|nr:hypothetical protein [Acidimicrobiales bacterium]